MLGTPTHKEMEGHTICLQCDKFQVRRAGVGVARCRHGKAQILPGGSNQGRHPCEGNADVKKNREFTQQTWGLSGDVIGKRRWCPWKRH